MTFGPFQEKIATPFAHEVNACNIDAWLIEELRKQEEKSSDDSRPALEVPRPLWGDEEPLPQKRGVIVISL